MIDVPAYALAICEACVRAGGRGIIVGGFVRDGLLGIASKDIDIEVYGLDAPALEHLLGEFGEVLTVGRAFGVYKVKGLSLIHI